MKIKTTVSTIETNGKQALSANHLVFRNQGTDVVTINKDIVLAPGQSLDLGFAEWIDDTVFDFNFSGGSGNLVVITRNLI